MFVHSLVTERNYQWSVIGAHLFAQHTLIGVLHTLELTALAMLIGIVGGVVLAVMRLSPNPIVSTAAWLYIWFFRGTPVLVQLVLWFYFAALYPRISLGIPFGPEFVHGSATSLISVFVAAVLALGLNEAAYMAEIVRSGILSVDDGQTEAASSLGMTRMQTMRRIVLPQAMRFIVPPTGNETNSMLKTSSIASFIAFPELFQSARDIYEATYQTIPLLLMASIWYLFMTSLLTIGQYYIERYFGRGTASRTATSLPKRLLLAIRYIRPQFAKQ
jgi:polar amino acid transport system permease protein